jgi:hypothetical protein
MGNDENREAGKSEWENCNALFPPVDNDILM